MHTYQPCVKAATSRLRDEKGVMSLVTALSVLMLLGVTALGVDLGNAWMVQQELRNASDAAALAGANQLGQIYLGLSADDQKNYNLTSVDLGTIEGQVQSLTPNSFAGGTPLNFNAADIVVGQWDSTTQTLTAGTLRPTAVQVRVRRDNTANQPLATFFAGVIGVESINLDTSATAAMTTISSTAPGGLGAPIGISEKWLETGNCDGNIKFYPTQESCSAWHSFTDTNSNANNIGNIVQGLEAGTFTAPEAVAGQTNFYFNGGTMASVFDDFEALYIEKNVDGNWRVLIPVYKTEVPPEDPTCDNPSGAILIKGFVTATIWEVVGAPSKTINAIVECDSFGSGRGDGTTGGTEVITPLGTIPGLVG